MQRSLAVAEQLDETDDSPLAAAALRIHAERVSTAARDRHVAERFHAAHPGVPVVQVAAQPTDVHDLDGLRLIGSELAAGDRAA